MASQSVNKRLAWSFTLALVVALSLVVAVARICISILAAASTFSSLLLLDLILKEIKQKSKPKAARRHKHSKAGVELSVEWFGVWKRGGRGREESHGVLRELLPPTSMVT